MARAGAFSRLWLLAAGLLLVVGPAGAAEDTVDKLSLSERPKQTPGMKFKDAWSAKLIGTKAGNDYKPDKVDWASVIQAVRVICAQEMRICNWCTRECFHDGGANEVNDVAYVIGTNTGQVITAPAGSGGFDSSVLLNVGEQLRDENRYDSFSTFVAAVIRTLVGFYDISYSDGLAVCGAVAREMLSYGSVPVYTMMPAVDASFPTPSARTQPFLVGRLDTNVANGVGILPAATLTTQGAADWANKHLARGIYDLLALLGSHALLDNKQCVKNNDTSGPFAKKQRMFSWNAPATYYTEMATPKLEGPIPDQESENNYRVDPPPHPLSIVEQERCKFTSTPFQDAAVASVQAALANPVPSDPEPSFEWIDEKLLLDDPTPADVMGRRRLAQAAGHPAAAAGGAVRTASNSVGGRRSLAQTAAATTDPAAAATVAADPAGGKAADPAVAAGAVDPAGGKAADPAVAAGAADPAGGKAADPAAGAAGAAEPVVVEPVDPPRAPRPRGPRTRRTCDYEGICYDGWPYTQNDGFMGQTAQKRVTAAGLEADVYNAVTAFQKPSTFNAAYGHAFVRILNNGATFVKVNGKSGMSITGWECKKWVSGDGTNKKKNEYCQKSCFVEKDDGKTLGCPTQLAEPYLSKVDPSKYNCRCSTAPWGQKATQLLTPNATQSIVGRVDLIATPSGITPSGVTTGRRRLLVWQPAADKHHAAACDHGGGGRDGGGKPKCPFEALMALGSFF